MSEQGIVPDETRQRFQALVTQLANERLFQELTPVERRERLRRVMGIGRGLFSPSDKLIRRKQEDIEIEDRPLGRIASEGGRRRSAR